jgi:diketogulonate reductase-like aldo/keto reductase
LSITDSFCFGAEIALNRTLTVAGVEMTRIGLGTNRVTHTPEHVEFIRSAIPAGVQMIDTAWSYAGRGERGNDR